MEKARCGAVLFVVCACGATSQEQPEHPTRASARQSEEDRRPPETPSCTPTARPDGAPEPVFRFHLEALPRGRNAPFQVAEEPSFLLTHGFVLRDGASRRVVVTLCRPDGTTLEAAYQLVGGEPDIPERGVIRFAARRTRLRELRPDHDGRGAMTTLHMTGTYFLTIASEDGLAHAEPLEILVEGSEVLEQLAFERIGRFARMQDSRGMPGVHAVNGRFLAVSPDGTVDPYRGPSVFVSIIESTNLGYCQPPSSLPELSPSRAVLWFQDRSGNRHARWVSGRRSVCISGHRVEEADMQEFAERYLELYPAAP